MDISSVSSSGSLSPEEIQMMYTVKMIQMMRESEEVVGSIIQDTVEISQEAMEKFGAEFK